MRGSSSIVAENPGGVPAETVLTQVDRISQSECFRRCKRLCSLLHFLIQAAIGLRGGEIKEYEIGLEVFGRDPSWDPTADPIVRVEVARLRSRLARYYGGEGQRDPVWISLPGGVYVPVVRLPEARTACSVGRVIAVLPFVDLTGQEHGGPLAEGLAEELIAALSQVAGLRVVCRTSVFRFQGACHDIREITRELNAAVLVEGVVRNAGPRFRVMVRLIDAMSGCILWSGCFYREIIRPTVCQTRTARAIIKAMMPHLLTSPVAPSSAHRDPAKAA